MVAYHIKSGSKKRAAVKTVADESEVSIRKVYRDVERAELVATIDDEVKPVTANMSTPAVKKLASLPKPKQKAAAERAGGDGKKLEKEVKKDTPAEAAAKVKSIAHQHRDKLVRAIDDYHQHKPNAKERDRLVKVTQNVSLW
jgi:Skp family chaperone for outer membrane proteins